MDERYKRVRVRGLAMTMREKKVGFLEKKKKNIKGRKRRANEASWMKKAHVRKAHI